MRPVGVVEQFGEIGGARSAEQVDHLTRGVVGVTGEHAEGGLAVLQRRVGEAQQSHLASILNMLDTETQCLT